MACIDTGTILADESDRFLVAWELLPSGVRLGMPIHRQTAPVNRAHVPLEPPEADELLGLRLAMVINTHERVVVSEHLRIVGQPNARLIRRIATTVERARHASNAEQLARAP